MKFYSRVLKLSALFFVFALFSCEEKTKKETPESTSETSETTTEIPKENNIYFAWVDNINIRDAANTKENVIGTYTTKDTLEFTGTKSDTKDIIVLRGVVYDEHWLKVTTKDNKEGWVFGGAVKKETESKGNGIITKDVFAFPHFGNFDIASWTSLGIEKREAGDAETTTSSYMKGNQIIEIEKTDVGEYGYYYTYRLLDAKRNLLKERKFSFTTGMGDEGNLMELTEIVKDYTTKKQYERKQMLTKHFMQLNARPEMVNGTWQEMDLKIEDSKK